MSAWLDAGQREVLLQTLEAVCSEIPTVDEGGHAHCYDDAGASALEQLGPLAIRALADSEPRPVDLLQKAFQQGRHHADPQRVDDDQVLRPCDVLLGCC